MTPYFGPSHFTYDAVQDVYVCPQGQPLRPFRTEQKAEKVEYRADAATCNACPLKAQCTSSQQGRQLHRSFHANYLERVKGYHHTPAYQKAMNKRKVWVEPLFAEAKDWHGRRRFRLRLHGLGQLRSLAHRGWAKSQAAAQKAWLEAPSFPNGGSVRLLFRTLPMVQVPCFGVSVPFLVDWLTFPHEQARAYSPLSMSFVNGFFNRLVTNDQISVMGRSEPALLSFSAIWSFSTACSVKKKRTHAGTGERFLRADRPSVNLLPVVLPQLA
jgi:Transposase DDE domain